MIVDEPEQLNGRFGVWASAGSHENPYPYLAEFRRHGAVVEGDVWRDTPFEPTPHAATIVRFDAAQQVLRDDETFSLEVYRAGAGQVLGRTLLEMSGREHHAHRSVMQSVFTRKAVAQDACNMASTTIDMCIDAIAENGRADLIADLTLPFPVSVIAGLLGLPIEDLPRFRRWAVELVSVGFDFQRSVRAAGELREYLGAIVDERRGGDGEDLATVLSQSRAPGRRMTDDEIFSALMLLLPAGAETSYRSTSNLLYGLLHHPEQLALLRNDRSLLPNAIEEGLRWETAVASLTRVVTRDVVLEGVELPTASLVEVSIGSANHDETYWERPDEFDITRAPRPLISFGSGPHMCLGLHLVRAETAILLDKLLDRLPGLRLDPDAPEYPITGFSFRAPEALPVIWDAP